MTCRYDQIGRYKVYISKVNCTSNPCAVEPTHYRSLIPGKHIGPIQTDFLLYCSNYLDYSTQAGSVILTHIYGKKSVESNQSDLFGLHKNFFSFSYGRFVKRFTDCLNHRMMMYIDHSCLSMLQLLISYYSLYRS